MSREPIRIRRIFQTGARRPPLSWEIRRRFRRLCPGCGQVAHVLRTLSPVAAKVSPPRAAPRLACVKPAASVHPEPGSNSSLYILILQALPRPSPLLQEINALDSLFSVLACTLSFSIFNELSRSSRKGTAKVNHFFESTKFFLKNFSGKIPYICSVWRITD